MDEEEPSRAAGGCVLVVLGGGAFAVAFAVSPEAGVLTVWVVGTVAVWRAARRRIGTDLALPSPTAAPSHGDVYAGDTLEAERVVTTPGGLIIVYPKRVEIAMEAPNVGAAWDN